MRETLLVASNESFRTYDATTAAALTQSQETFAFGPGVIVKGLFYSQHLSKPLIRCSRLDKPHESHNRLLLPDVVQAFDVSPSSSYLVAAFEGARLMAWDLRTGNLLKAFSLALDCSGEIGAVRISQQEHAVVVTIGRTCLVYALCNFIQTLDLTPEAFDCSIPPIYELRCDGLITAMDCMFPTSNFDPLICLGDSGGQVYCWEPKKSERTPSWTSDLHARVTALAIMTSLARLIVASDHPDLAIIEFDIFKCARLQGPILWEDHAKIWSRDSVPTLTPNLAAESPQESFTLTCLRFSQLERLVGAVTKYGVLIWDYEKRGVHRFLSQDKVTEIAFSVTPPTPASITDNVDSMALPPAPLDAPTASLKAALNLADIAPAKLEDCHTKPNFDVWLAARYPSFREPLDLLALTPEVARIVRAHVVTVAEVEKQSSKIKELDEQLARARACFKMLCQFDQAGEFDKPLKCVHQVKANLLFESVNPLIGSPPVSRAHSNSGGNIGYFVPPPSWQQVVIGDIENEQTHYLNITTAP